VRVDYFCAQYTNYFTTLYVSK